MLTFHELSDAERAKAVEHATIALLEAILEGALRFDDDELNGSDLQARIDRAIAKAEAMQTPWFAHEYIMETCREDIEGMARSDAEGALYAEPHERVVRGIIV